MADYVIQGGQRFSASTPDEVRRIFREEAQLEQLAQRERVRGIKSMDLPETLSGKPASSALALGAAHGTVLGPLLGYTWFFTRLVLSGLSSGDAMNLYKRDDFGGVPMWQFNGVNFGYTWGKGQMFLKGGMTLNLQNSGNLNATGVITLGGAYVEVPAEREGEYLA